MPELPEVETIKNGLTAKLIGKTISDIEIFNEKSFQGNIDEILDSKVISISRRAKTIRIELSNNLYLVFHLKMTGQLIYIENEQRIAGGHPSNDWFDRFPNKHTRIVFVFGNKTKLFFNDLRKFGWCRVMDEQQLNEFDQNFGPEPFTKELTVGYLKRRAEKVPSRTLIQFIMDQNIIAGVGNIYANEALFLAGIMPTTRVKFLKDADWENVINKISVVLEKGIKYGGTTDNNYVDIEGNKGEMQFHLNVYHRTGEKCPNGCSGKIEKIKLGGRGAFFCKACQKELK